MSSVYLSPEQWSPIGAASLGNGTSTAVGTITIAVGDAVATFLVPADERNAIAAGIAADLLAALPVIGEPA